MRARFNKLDARSQRHVVVVTALLLLVLGAALSWQVHGSKRSAAAAVDASAQDLLAMDELLARYEQLQQQRGTGVTANNEDLTALVNRTLQGRSFQPTRIQQGVDGELQLRLDDVAFADALAWLTELENTGGVVVGAVTVNQAAAGSASLTLVLRR
jgi:type II secretory pathway component PulM